MEKRYTKEEREALADKMLERRKRQAESQAKRREKLKAEGKTALTMTVSANRVEEIKALVSYFEKHVRKGDNFALFVKVLVDGKLQYIPANKVQRTN